MDELQHGRPEARASDRQPVGGSHADHQPGKPNHGEDLSWVEEAWLMSPIYEQDRLHKEAEQNQIRWERLTFLGAIEGPEMDTYDWEQVEPEL